MSDVFLGAMAATLFMIAITLLESNQPQCYRWELEEGNTILVPITDYQTYRDVVKDYGKENTIGSCEL